MINQEEIDRLISMLKHLTYNSKRIDFPPRGSKKNLPVESQEKPKEIFRIVINNTSRISGKCSFLNIHRNDNILLRLDIKGPKHVNPDGEEIDCPHLHIAREGYDDKWAYSLDSRGIDTFEDLVQQLYEFMVYCNIINHTDYSIQFVFDVEE